MSWLNVWDSFKNKICRYLLQRYLGRFLDDKLRLEQLKIELYNGKATVQNVTLNVDTLNELFEEQGWAVEVVSGHIGELIVTVPWNALMINNSSIEVSDLVICIRPIQRQSNGTSMLESMWSSVSSSMQLAEECLKQDMDTADKHSSMHVQAIDGLEKFAETIDNVLNRITAKFSNTTIRLEQQLYDEQRYISFSITIKDFYYKNESGNEIRLAQATTKSKKEEIRLLSTFAKHNIDMSGIIVYTEECSKNDNYNYLHSVSKNLKSAATLIPILEIKGQQRAIVRIKQSEEVSGPKILLDVELGTINTILTPRQVHLILQFCKAFNEEDPVIRNQKRTKKDHLEDRNEHSESIEIGFQSALNEGLIWGESIENNTTLEGRSDNCESLSQRSKKLCDSLASSISSGSTMTSTIRFQRKLASMASCGEIVKFNIRIASCALHILHEDIVIESSTNHNLLNEKSVENLLQLSNSFFNEWADKYQEGDGKKPRSLQDKNYIYVFLSPILLDGIQQRNKNVLLLKLSGTATKIYVNEVLQGVDKPLIVFDREEDSSDGCQKRPNISFAMKSTFCNLESLSKVAFDVILEQSTLELDISIYDRLSALLGPSPFKFENSYDLDTTVKCSNFAKTSSEVNIVCNLLHVNLRFPIVDIRPIHDPNRTPWWKQNVRDDFLQLDIYQMQSTLSAYSYDILMTSLDIFYCEDVNSKVHFLRANLTKEISEKLESDIESFKINVTLKSNQKTAKGCTNNDFLKAQPNFTPFSAQRVCRQSDTVHKKRDYAEAETILLPGNKEELKAFRDSTIENSKVQIQLTLPNVTMMLQSKQFYEVLYNRFNYNLFLWEPTSPLFKGCSREQNTIFEELSEIHLSADSIDSDKEADKSKACFYESDNSDTKNMPKQSKNVKFSTFQKNCLNFKDSSNMSISACAVELLVRSGILTCLVPVRDGENHVLPEHSGRIDFHLSDLQMFLVNGYRGNISMDYVFLQIKDFEMFHCGLIPESCPKSLSTMGFLPQYMNSTIYKVPPGLTKDMGTKNPKRDMISLAIEIKKKAAQKIKRIRATAGLQTAALQYNTELSSHFWLHQIIDFLDVKEYAMDGYQPFGVLTEMQCHLWDLVIDYRPTQFNYCSVLEVGTFSISSNIISTINGCSLRFIVEDFVLEIGPNIHKTECQKNQRKLSRTDNLVPVFDIGLLDISVRLSNKISEVCPKFDLRCSIHDANLRTCSDSGKVLAQLITHIANDGDFCTKGDEKDFLHQSSSENNVLPQQYMGEFKNVTEKQQERVNSMMADAVQDTKHTFDSKKLIQENISLKNRGIEVFYFPDESSKLCNKDSLDEDTENKNELNDLLNFEFNVMSNTYYSNPKSEDALPSVKEDLGVITKELGLSTTSDDEFCLISEDEKIFKNRGIPNVQVSNEPLRIVDNHFRLPLDKPDLLDSPENFPMAETRYTICEMTFTWHLYGGSDFPEALSTSDENKKIELQHRMSEAYKYGVSYSKNSSNVKFMKDKEKLTWKKKGGPQRNHQVLVEIHFSKVRFSHEVYPAYTSHASRQVLVVNEIEIRDRLQSSEINKFLYHPNVNNLANKTPQHMLVVKALHVRTESSQDSDQECSLRISLLPLRLHIDQDTLIFLAEYFSSFGDTSNFVKKDKTEQNSVKFGKGKKSASPVMGVEALPEAIQDLRARNLVSANLDLLMHNTKEDESNVVESNLQDPPLQSRPIYFREVIFSPEVSIRLDYHGRRVELSRGPITGLLMGLGQLQCSEIRLRKLLYRRGLLGVEKLVTYMCKEWLKDIKRNQLPKILSGVGPTYAFVQLFHGVYDLFWMPIEQYQKDGRLIRGIQLGAQSFTARTALAALEITSRFIHLLQLTAETAFDMVSPGPSVRRHGQIQKGKKKRPNRPKDIREGMTNAYIILKEGINDSAANLIETAAIEHDQKGYTGAVGAVMRQIPQLVVCPAVLATQATTNILGGVKNSLVPEAKMEAREKWKGSNE